MDINNISFNLVALGAFNNQKSNEKTDDILISPEQLFSSKTHLSGLQSGEIPASIFNIQENAFPPIRTESFKNLNYFYNMHGENINVINKDDSKTYSVLFDNGLSLILKDNFDKRDTLVFSNMGDNVGKNSNIPNIFFHINGEESKMYFNKEHDLVVDLGNGEQLLFDGKTGDMISGPFQLDFDPGSAKIDVKYQGSDSLSRYKSFGDNIKW